MRLTRALSLTALITVLLIAHALSANTRTIRVSIDTTKTREPISEYIYGQFIEHFGRCIYGGIWSEMLEDRKFFYPVTGEAPAWTMCAASVTISPRPMETCPESTMWTRVPLPRASLACVAEL